MVARPRWPIIPDALRVLYVIGHSRSGSTVLQHLLGLQPGVHAVGELHRLGELAREGGACACGEVLSACPFWSGVCADRPPVLCRTHAQRSALRWRVGLWRELAALRRGSAPAGRWARAREHAVAEECVALHRAAAAATGSELVVDSSKEPDHFLHLRASFPNVVFPLFLHRDGRGVVWSKMQRTGQSVAEAIDSYVWVERLIERVRRACTPETLVEVRYEDLCARPREELERILAPYGIAVRSVDLSELAPLRHDIGGSPSFAGEHPSSLRLDERWRDEMPADVQAEFARRAGALNRRRGYDESTAPRTHRHLTDPEAPRAPARSKRRALPSLPAARTGPP